MFLQAGINIAIVAAFMASSILANIRATQYQARAKALGLTTRGSDIEHAKQWLFVSTLAVIMAGTITPIMWAAFVDKFNPPLWLKASQLAVSAIIVIGGVQFMLRRRRLTLHPKQ